MDDASARYCPRANSAARLRVALLATLFGLVTWAAPSRAEEVTISQVASRHFSEGVRYLTSDDADRFQKAYREFKAAYADSPSWKILGNLGIVAHELERDGEAMDAYSRYLEQGGDALPADERKQFTRDLELLRASHSTVVIEIGPVPGWLIDERLPEAGARVVNRYGPTRGPLELRVRAGHHRIRVERDGYETQRWEISVDPGDRRARSFELVREGGPEDPAPTPVSPAVLDEGTEGSSAARVGAYVSFGVSAAALGVGSWFLYDVLQKRQTANELHDQCLEEYGLPPSSRCPRGPGIGDEAYEADQEEARAWTPTVIGLSAGGAALATGIILLWTSSPSEPDDVALVPLVGPGMLGVRGRF